MKLLRLRYTILYRKGKENIVAVALSMKHNNSNPVTTVGELDVITSVLSAWYEQAHASYAKESKLQTIIMGTMIGVTGDIGYTYAEGVLRYKDKIVVGQDGEFRTKLVKFVHDSYVGGHAGIQNTF